MLFSIVKSCFVNPFYGLDAATTISLLGFEEISSAERAPAQEFFFFLPAEPSFTPNVTDT